MKRKSIVIGVAAAVAGILTACGHDHDGGSPPTPPPANTNISVTTSGLLTGYAEKPSETAQPIIVNGGVFTISDTSETTSPVSVNAN